MRGKRPGSDHTAGGGGGEIEPGLQRGQVLSLPTRTLSPRSPTPEMRGRFSSKDLTPKVYTPHSKKRVRLSPSASSSSLPSSPAPSLLKYVCGTKRPHQNHQGSRNADSWAPPKETCSNKFPHSSPLVTDVPCRLTAWGWWTAELLSAKGLGSASGQVPWPLETLVSPSVQ